MAEETKLPVGISHNQITAVRNATGCSHLGAIDILERGFGGHPINMPAEEAPKDEQKPCIGAFARTSGHLSVTRELGQLVYTNRDESALICRMSIFNQSCRPRLVRFLRIEWYLGNREEVVKTMIKLKIAFITADIEQNQFQTRNDEDCLALFEMLKSALPREDVGYLEYVIKGMPKELEVVLWMNKTYATRTQDLHKELVSFLSFNQFMIQAAIQNSKPSVSLSIQRSNPLFRDCEKDLGAVQAAANTLSGFPHLGNWMFAMTEDGGRYSVIITLKD